MVVGKISRGRIVIAVWWVGVVISTVTLLSSPYRHGEIDLSLRSPFDNTGSGHAEQWLFLTEAARHVPRGASFTVLAPDRDTEMSLYMMAVGLLPEALPLPSSYFGQPTGAGDNARFVLEFDDRRDMQPQKTCTTTITGGRVTDRWVSEP
jgi:hypothetical protein